jgi:hypothetical protein
MATTLPDLGGLATAWNQAEEQQQFWESRSAEFLEMYPDRFVAVHNEEVVAVADRLEELLDMLKSRGLDRRSVWVRFIMSDPKRYIL